MPTYQVAYNATTRVARIQFDGDTLPVGSTDIGSFIHDGVGDPEGYVENHVFYHHVRDLLYKIGEENMQTIRIDLDSIKNLTGISSTPATVTLAVAATRQIVNTFTPSDATNKAVTYVSSNPSKATVSATGLITAVATGSATITVTTVDGGFTDTVVVTVS